MSDGIFLFGNSGHLPKELVLRSSFAWIALSGGNIFSDYVSVDHEPVLVHDRFKGIDNPCFFLFCMSDLFDRAWVDGSKVSFKKLTEHSESKVTFDQYLFDLVFLRKEGEFLKINFAVTTLSPPEARRKRLPFK